MTVHNIKYKAVPTMARLHRSAAFYRCVIGPVRSGKSVGNCAEIFRRACEQKPQNGVRRTRFAAIRQTYRELEDTTVKTWLDWFPEDIFGRLNRQTMTQTLKFRDVEMEIMFRALDRPGDVKKLLSLELTGAWINEARELPKIIIDAVGDRVGQFPAKKDGGCTWCGVILDTNPPDTDDWLYKLAEEERPNNWEFFRQPGGLVEVDGKFVANPLAENLKNLNEGVDYYLNRLGGKQPDYVRVYYCGQYGFVIDGKPVHPEYVDKVHCPDEIIKPIPGRPLVVGLDFGLTPAAVILQQTVGGQWRAIDEITTEHMGIQRFGQQALIPMLRGDYKGYEFDVFGDPAGSQEAQTDERTPYQILQALGLMATPAGANNDPIIRRESLSAPLGRMIDGRPGLIISPKCKVLRKGLMGGYCYKRLQVSGQDRYQDKPVKNKYSHVVEALEYALQGAGEGLALITGIKSAPKKLRDYGEDDDDDGLNWKTM